MAERRLFRLRVIFAKRGRLAMLSHLELCRALERAVRRAKLPYAVSEGFSPHMRISFGSALPVGVGGDHELFDLLLERYVPPARALEALRLASADDLMVDTCHYVEPSAPSASAAYPLCTYEAVLAGSIDELVVPGTIRVVRKKKERTLVVAEFLHGEVQVAPVDEGHEAEAAGRSVDEHGSEKGDMAMRTVLRFTLEAKQTGSLRPDVFLRHCIDETVQAGKGSPDLAVLSITRVSQEEISASAEVHAR